MQGKLRPIAKDMAILADGANRIGDGFKNQRSSIDTAVRGLSEYRKEMGKAAAAQQKLQKRVNLPTISGGGGGGSSFNRPRGGGGGGGAAKPEEAGGLQKMGLGAMTLAGGAVGVGFTAATAALNGIRGAAAGFVQSGSQAQQAVIQMAGTLQTLGKVGDFKKSQEMAEGMMKSLSKVASALPGSTEDYLTILQQTLDDQIQAFGSVQAVQQNLQGLGKDGKKLAGGMEQSFTALFGMAAQISGLAPQVAAMDLNQLRASPTNLKQVQVLSRNPTLSKYYLEELKKSGGNFILALNNAMKKAITPEQVEALKNSFDSAYQSFVTTFTDAYSGILAPMRKVSIQVATNINGVAGTMEKSVTSMELLGVLMRNINDIIAVLLGTGIDPLVMLNQFLYELGYQAYKLRMDLEGFAKDGLGLGEFGESIGTAIGSAAADFTDWVLNLDYDSFFQGVDELVFGFFKGLFSGFLKSFSGVEGGNKGPFGGLGTSVSGTVVSLLLLTKTITMAASAFTIISGLVTTVTTFGAGIATVVQVGFPMLTAALSGAASAFAAAALPALAIVGAFLALVAVFRHGDFIMSSLWEAVQLVGNGLTWLYQSFQMVMAKLSAAILDFMSKLPIVGDKFKDAAAAANARVVKLSQDRLKTEAKIAANTKKIGENTTNSLKRTKEDFAKIGGAFKGAMPKGSEKAKPAEKPKASPVAAAKPAAAPKSQPAAAPTVPNAQPQIKSGFDNFMAGVKNMFGQAGTMLAQAGASMGGWLNSSLIQPVANFFKGVAAAVGGASMAVSGWLNTYVIQPFGVLFTAIGGLIFRGLSAMGSLVNTHVIAPVSAAFMTIGGVISQGFMSLVGLVQAYIISPIVSIFNQIRAGVSTAASVILAAWSSFVNTLKNVFLNLGSLAGQAAGVIKGAVMSGVQSLGNAIKGAIMSAASFVGGIGKPGAAPPARRAWDGEGNVAMPLHQAISSEMRNKPPGSDLVIANSSETIIPAADGLNMGGLEAVVNATYSAAQSTAGVFTTGFQAFSQKLFAGQQAMVGAVNRGTQVSATQSSAMLAKLSAQNAALMSKMTAVAAAAGNAGGGAGGAIALGGGYGSRGSQIAGALGTYIKQTGGAPGSIHEHPQHGGVKYKHSPNSYHYKGRAIDIGAYANEQGGVLRRVAEFNAKMGVKPVELLKAGDPGHSDHVHVAYAMGSGNPAFFNSASAADSWEAMMSKGSPIISSVRARANEMQGGGPMTVNAPITINAQPGQDTDALASLVAIKLTQAVNQLRYSSYNV
jgi:hypothetical protein